MLIDNIDILRGFIPTIANTDFSRYSTYLETADEWLKREITGTALFGKLKDEANFDLLRLAQAVVAHKGYLEAIPFLDLVETETGFGVVSGGNIVPASKERVQALIKQTEQRFSDACESLIIYLEQNISNYPEWKQSSAFSLITDCIIHSLDEFRRYAPFAGTHLDFVKAKPVLRKIQVLKIQSTISAALVAEIVSQLQNGSISENNAKIIEQLRFALAIYTISDPEFKAIFNNNPYELKAIENLKENTYAESFLNQAYNYIVANPDSFPAFKTSDIYARLQSVSTSTVTDSKIEIFGV